MKILSMGWVLLLWCQLASGADIRAGVAKISITPTLPAWLNGYASREQPANGILTDIWAKALVLEDAPGSRVVIVTVDLLGLSHDVVTEVARQVDSLYGIRRSQLLLNSSHTHSAPVVWPCLDMIYNLGPEDQARVSLYVQELTVKLVKVIGMAMRNMAPARLFTGHGSADFAINRRNEIHPNGPVDHDVPVLKVVSTEDKPLAILFGYACHNTTLVDDNLLVNGDFAGFAQIALEKAYPGAQAMFLMGCAGDQNPSPRGTVALAMQHGKSLADAVVKVLSGEMHVVRAPIRTAYTRTALPFPPFDAAKYRQEIVSKDRFLQRRARLMLDLYNRGLVPDHKDYPVQVVRFNNDLCILGLSDEVVVDYSLRAKREFAGENIYVAGYSGEVMCYIPSERVLKEGGYEGGENMIYYGWPGPFAEGVEDRVFDAIYRVMKEAGGKEAKRK
ncbi:MAG TPA: neutral/alkaline non-lysosomal ceramidase N-terminal domain-containing protein [Puia sp.]|nr:neutral/alkaline non-lysosomal ceramidase N-terminal domain-containing protein [Puia sp.]